MRLNDEKRQKVQIGDFIEFSCLDNLKQKIQTRVTALHLAVFGYPDAFKLRSCMTLFKHAAPEQDLFQKVLDKFCHGNEDEKTLKILGL